MKIEMCIPAWNEERIIAESAVAVRDSMKKISSDSRVVVCVNGSTDGTAESARKVNGVSVLTISTRGKGAAVIAAARASSAGIFGFIDADLSAPPSSIRELFLLVQNDACDIAIGSRLIDKSTVRRGILRTLTSEAFNALRRCLVGVRVRDSQCGLKVMNARGREILAGCEEKGWFFDIEFLARAERAGLRVREVPVPWDEYHYPGRKAKLRILRDGIESIRAMIRIRGRLSH